MLLSAAGCEVTILERQVVGGDGPRPSRLTASDSIWGRPSSCTPAFSNRSSPRSAATFSQETPMIRLDPQYRLIFGAGGDVKATPDVERMEREIATLSPRDALQLRRFLADNRLKMDEFRSVLESPFLRWRNMLSPDWRRCCRSCRPWLSLEASCVAIFRTARSAGNDVSIQVSWHVSVQLPEPLLDPFVH